MFSSLRDVRVMFRLAAITLLTVLIAACSAAQATGPNTLYLPLSDRNFNARTPTAIPPSPTATPAGVYVASSTGRNFGLGGTHFVYALVTNGSPSTVYSTRATVTYYRGSTVVDSMTDSTELRMLRPGESSPVWVVSEPQSGWDRYDIQLTTSPTSDSTYVHDGLTLGGMNTSVQDSSVYVAGTLTNTSGDTVNTPTVIVVIFDKAGAIVDETATQPFGSSVAAPGATRSFNTSFYNADKHIPGGYSFKVFVEGIRSLPDD